MPLSLRTSVDARKAQRYLRSMPKRLSRFSTKTRRAVAQEILDIAKKLAPKDATSPRGGALKESGRIIERRGVTMVAFNRTEPWKNNPVFDVAVWTHQNRSYTPTTPGTGPRYLTRARDRVKRRKMNKIVQTQLRAALRA